MRQTVVNQTITVGACISRVAMTCVFILPIFTTAMLARVAGTLIDISFTMGASVARFALTQVVVDLVIAGGAVNAWVRFTFINFSLTVDSSKSRETLAFVFVLAINTFSIDARIRQALINISLAMLSSKPWWAETLVFIDFVHAGCLRRTWVRSTLINVTVAVNTSPSRVAVAEVMVDAVLTFAIDTWV